MSNAIDTTDIERRLAERISPTVTDRMALRTNATGGLAFANMTEVMEFARAMAIAQVGVRKHLRGNVGACLAITVQAIEWQMSPFAVANKSYAVNDQIAYEAQMINAVILARAPIKGRFKVEYRGEGETRQCKVSVKLRDEDGMVEYESPVFSKILPKNSPLWKTDPDQQLFYFSSRSLCRRHFPDVLLGVYTVDELFDESLEAASQAARDVTPRRSLADKIDALIEDHVEHKIDGLAANETVDANGEIHQVEPNPGAPDTRVTPAAGQATEPAKKGGDDRSSKSSPPDKPSPEQERAKTTAKVFEGGQEAAAKGQRALYEYLDALSGDAVALLQPKTLKDWRQRATAADQNRDTPF